MNDNSCSDVELTGETDSAEATDIPPPQKVLAPFLKTLKKRRKEQVNLVNEECREIYLSRNPEELLVKLEDSFTDPLKLTTILNETAELLRVVTASKSVNLYLTDNERNIITVCPRFIQKNDRFFVRYRIESGKTLAAYVAYTKEYVITSEILGDARFPEGIPGTDNTVKAALCVPVLMGSDGNCIGVIELYRDFRQPNYDSVNLQICIALCGWVGVGVQQNSTRLKITKDVEIRKYLLSLAQLYFEGVLSFEKAISDLIVFSKAAVKAYKSSFYLLDGIVPFGSEKDIFAEVFEEALEEIKGLAVFRKKTKARFEYQRPGVAGYAARTGEVISIGDAYKDHRFDQTSDPVDYRTRSIVAVPIKNIRGVTAVLVLSNKLTGEYFNEEDIAILDVFASSAALICEYEDQKNQITREGLKLDISRGLLFEHIKAPQDDINAFKCQPVLSAQQMPPGFFRFDWNSNVYDEEIIKYILFAFLGSETIENLLDHSSLISFALSVKKTHRPLPYHNFEHAFTVFHFLYNVIYRNKDKFTDLEVLSLLLAGLCHDLDHTGVTNSFLELQKEPVAQLYDEFPLEEHHFQLCLLLIQANNLLSKFTSEEYTEITNEIHRLILATNLSFYLRSKKQMVRLLNENLLDWNNPEHRTLIKGFLITCAEFSANFRTFDYIRKSTDNFYKELFIQGDMERTMGFTPVAMMDRSQITLLPDYHLGLLTMVVEPCTEIVVTLFPNCEEILSLCRDGINKWKELIALRDVEVWRPEESYSKEKRSRGHRNTVFSILSSQKSAMSDDKSRKTE